MSTRVHLATKDVPTLLATAKCTAPKCGHAAQIHTLLGCGRNCRCTLAWYDVVAATVQPPMFPLERTWKLGDAVEHVTRDRWTPLRPGIVDHIERQLVVSESLIIAFDDGETRGINPSVMRHIRP